MTQTEALQILKTGGNVFLTGEPGAGKTYVLNQYIEWLEDCGVTVAVTASTGIAATHIGGMTIHAWSGIGARDDLSDRDLEAIAEREKVSRRIRNAKVLVIDEVSMLDGRLLDMVERVCRRIRQSDDAFGGLQIILVGDFFQLPPIARPGEQPQFAFQSDAWQRARFLTCYLTEQFRHEDELLSALLSAIRTGEVEEEHYTLLSEQTEIAFAHIEPTRLFSHNRDVDAMNITKLRELSGASRRFTMESRGARHVIEALKKSCLSPELLELKEEAMVMCTKNNFDAGYVNGTLGRVVGFDPEDGYPIIETGGGERLTIMPAPWSVEENGKPIAEVTQVPLRLAWAITIHKSQGMSLDAAEIDLSRAFSYGQGYVALSRVRTLAGMKVLGVGANALMIDPQIIATDARFREMSENATTTFAGMDQAELTKMQHGFVTACGGKIPKPGTAKRERGRGRSAARLKKESTDEITRGLLEEGKSVQAIARARGMALSTIWGHVEKLATEGKLGRERVAVLAEGEHGFTAAYPELTRALNEHGTERLKPIYEACGEKYDYDLVRLARLLYNLEK